MFNFTAKKGRLNIDCSAIMMGKDLCVVITGGNKPHLGAVALAAARASLSEPRSISASTSVLTLLGHKDDEVARKVAYALSSRLGKNVVVSCGIHLDGITEEEISLTFDLINQMTEEMINIVNPV